MNTIPEEILKKYDATTQSFYIQTLGDACDDLIDIRLKYEDLVIKESVVISRILEALRKEGRSSLKFKGYEFNVIAPNLRLSVRVIK